MSPQPTPTSISPAKQRANQHNAEKSTGPRTEEGKRRSSMNAMKHGLFCQDLVLPGEDKQAFDLMRTELIKSFNPLNLAELMLVDQILECKWKLLRVRSAQARLYKKLAPEVKTASGAGPACMLALLPEEHAQTFERFEKMSYRLENSLHRSIREFGRLRAVMSHEEFYLERSPYVPEEPDDPSEMRNEATEGRESPNTNDGNDLPAANAGASKHQCTEMHGSARAIDPDEDDLEFDEDDFELDDYDFDPDDDDFDPPAAPEPPRRRSV